MALNGSELVSVTGVSNSLPAGQQEITTTQAIANLNAGAAGVPSIAGTANQITETGSPGATTLSIPSDFRLPGTINKVTITQPATGSTLTIPDGVTLNAGAGGTLGTIVTVNKGVASATFTTVDSKTVTVVNGVITSVV
jgi:hypothetical protein